MARLPDGRRKQELQDSWEAVKADQLIGRIWPFSSEAAHWYGELVSHRERLGLPIEAADAVIAAIALEPFMTPHPATGTQSQYIFGGPESLWRLLGQ